jgi:hypothetical protein
MEIRTAYLRHTPALTVRLFLSTPFTFTHKNNVLTFLIELDLPEYDSYDVLRSQIIKAITQGSDYFGFA